MVYHTSLDRGTIGVSVHTKKHVCAYLTTACHVVEVPKVKNKKKHFDCQLMQSH
jgi:hypothetical protein